MRSNGATSPYRRAEDGGRLSPPMRSNGASSPYRSAEDGGRLSPPRRSNDASSPYLSAEEEFPDPEVDMADLSDEEFPKDDQDPDIGPIVPPNVQRSHLDEEGGFMSADQPRDEAMAAGMSNMNMSYHEQEVPERSKYQSIGIGGSKDAEGGNDYRRQDVSPQRDASRGRERNVSTSPEKEQYGSFAPPQRQPRQASESPLKSRSPKARVVSRNHLDEMVTVPDPSPTMTHLDCVSPMSAESASPLKGIGTPGSATSYTKSSAMRGAQELLKKNRQQRLAIMAKRRSSTALTDDNSTASDTENKSPYKPAKVIHSIARGRSVTPIRRSKSPVKALSPNNANKSPKSKVKMTMYKSPSSPRNKIISERSTKTLNETSELATPSPPSPVMKSPPPPMMNGMDDTRSESASATSSVWTDTTDLTQRDSRRALILKMAKSRMKSKRNNE